MCSAHITITAISNCAAAPPPPERALNFLLVGMCRADFQKLGLGSGFTLKNEVVLGAKIRKFCVLRAEILTKTKVGNGFFFLKLKMGAFEPWMVTW